VLSRDGKTRFKAVRVVVLPDEPPAAEEAAGASAAPEADRRLSLSSLPDTRPASPVAAPAAAVGVAAALPAFDFGVPAQQQQQQQQQQQAVQFNFGAAGAAPVFNFQAPQQQQQQAAQLNFFPVDAAPVFNLQAPAQQQEAVQFNFGVEAAPAAAPDAVVQAPAAVGADADAKEAKPDQAAQVDDANKPVVAAGDADAKEAKAPEEVKVEAADEVGAVTAGARSIP